jgi:hypothetical protein
VPDRPLRAGARIEEDGNLVVDTGDDFYTVGRPHPMIDQAVRCELIRTAGADESVGVLLLDLVLGDGSHLDPAPEIAAAVADARAARGGRPLAVACSVCGTDADPQGLIRQASVLALAGVRVEVSAARAARSAAVLIGGAR